MELTKIQEVDILEPSKARKHMKDKELNDWIKFLINPERIETARKLLEKGMDIKLIADVTGLTKEEIEKLM